MFNEQYAKLVAKFGKRNVLIGAAVIGVIVVGWVVNGIGSGPGGDRAGDGSYTVTTEDGTWSTSDKLPSDWPSDAPLYPGAKVQGSVAADGLGQGVGKYVGMESDDDVATVMAWYTGELAAKGWSITTNISTGEGSMLGATKDERTLVVTLGVQDGKTAIGLTIASK